VKVYIIAGEPSGDLLASGLMRALLRLAPDVKFRGVGGESMTAVGAGFKSLFEISDISVMGIFEVLPRLPLILKHIRNTVSDIEEFSPDVLVTVDSWGFVSALLTRLKKRGSKIPVVHYVAPQVWAWKKGRARNVARLVDRLMTLLPDEGRWFEPHGLRSDFVGHPVVERIDRTALDPDGFRAANGIPAEATVISVLPGSRHSETKRLIPILKEAIERVVAGEGRESADAVGAAKVVDAAHAVEAEQRTAKIKNIFVLVPTVPGVEKEVRRGFEDFPVPVRIVTGEANRYNAFAISKLALAKSGTVSLELVSFNVPHLIAYTFGRLSNYVAKALVKVRFANLINLLADREIIPEFVLDRCRPDLIADCATRLLTTPRSAERQVAEAQEVMQRLRLPDILPSDRAAQIVSEVATRVTPRQ
jgi:lipid-A-disaccharide synthase